MLGGDRVALRRFAAAGAALALIAGGCSSAAQAPAGATGTAPGSSPDGSISDLPINATFDQAVPYFAYDSSAPLEIRDAAGAVDRDGVTVRDITFAATGTRVAAYLVVPSGSGPFAGVVFLYPERAGGESRDTFLDEAIALARRGVVCLLPTRDFPGMRTPSSDWRTDRQYVVEQVVQSRRGIDLLLAQPGVDRERIGYVGDDFAGMSGAILTAVDRRVKTAVFMSLSATWAELYSVTYAFDETQRVEYPRGMTAVDPISALAHVAPTPVFLQYGDQSGFTPAEMRDRVSAAATGARMTVYPNSSWGFEEPEALADRTAWLVEHLGLKG